MRYKRENTLALDVSTVPTGHRLSIVQPFLAFLSLEPTKLRSVQVHSSQRTIYIGLPENHSAAAIAAKTPRFAITIDGIKHHVPLAFVDEDIVDVRVRDVPPEAPNDIIQQSLRKYGDVLSVANEVWRDFFPGVSTGVRIARMKITQNIPSHITIGSSLALINYTGQTETCSRCGEVKHPKAKCRSVADKTKKLQPPVPQNPSRQQNSSENCKPANDQQQQQKQTRTNKIDHPASNKQTASGKHTNEEECPPMDIDGTSSSGFTTVMRKRGKVTHQQQQEQQQKELINPATSLPQLSQKDLETQNKLKDLLLHLAKKS